MDEKQLFRLFQASADGTITPSEHEQLQSALQESAKVRGLWFLYQDIDAGLAAFAESPPQESVPALNINWRNKWIIIGAVAALVLVAAPWIFMGLAQPRVLARLASSENAAWESSLPTEPGSNLTRGYMNLTRGIATIQFRSGAEVMLEAPAKLNIMSPMRAGLIAGAAVINVPESAVGFVVETPQGHVVDHGTSFAVSVKNGKNRSDIEVIEGEVSLHSPSAPDSVRLVESEGASILEDRIQVRDLPVQEVGIPEFDQTIRIGTNGRSWSVISSNRPKWMHPELLSVKRKREDGNFERRSFFAFDLSEFDLDRVEDVRIRLVQVPSGIGYATRLPLISRIGVYGLVNQSKADWLPGVTWQEGPAPEDGIKLGDIEIPRSEQRGSRVFQSETLLEFLKTHGRSSATFILERETSDLKGDVPSLVHAFASDLHPEAVGPTLEITLKNQ